MGPVGEADAHTVGKHGGEKGAVYSVTCVLQQDSEGLEWASLCQHFLYHLIQIGELLLS